MEHVKVMFGVVSDVFVMMSVDVLGVEGAWSRSDMSVHYDGCRDGDLQTSIGRTIDRSRVMSYPIMSLVRAVTVWISIYGWTRT